MIEHMSPVDNAMQEDRPPKKTIRNLWVQKYKEVAKAYPNSETPYYLTLSGAEGKDIELIISEGLISLTETNGISAKDQNKIIAVENRNMAIAKLQSKFVGLRIKEANIQDLVRGTGQFAWPQGEDVQYCRARIINLDLDEPLIARIEENRRVVFPALEWIKKLCTIHSQHPRLDWTLCLTLHGQTRWPAEVNSFVQKFLVENFTREPEFARKTREFFTDDLYNSLVDGDINFPEISRETQQKLLMTIVPKFINQLVHHDGWMVRTEYNLRYGGGEKAPMVTWIMRFNWDQHHASTPDTIYKTSLKEIYDGLGAILDTGELEKHTIV